MASVRARLRVHCFGLSIDGYGAGPDPSFDDLMGVGGMALHDWVFPTRSFRERHASLGLGGDGPGSTGIDNDFVERSFAGIGAWIIGRTMFGPLRGPWPGTAGAAAASTDGAADARAATWRGCWGDDPPFHTPVFVLTHHPREPMPMLGGTTFHFVTGGIRQAYDLAMRAAEGKDVRLGGGVSAVRQYLEARLVDEMHVAVGRALLGSGPHLFAGLDLVRLGYEVAERTPSELATHIVLRRRS